MSDLISLSRARQSLQGAGSIDDAVLAVLISAASAAVEKHCQRTFVLTSYRERYDGDGSGRLWLKNFPIAAVTRVSAGRASALAIQQTDTTTNQRATVRVIPTGLVFARVAGGTTVTDSTVTFASSATIAALAAAVNALGAGWSASAHGDFGAWPSTDIFDPQGPFDCRGAYAYLEAFESDLTVFELLDAQAGLIAGDFSRGVQNLLVEYQAGFATIPEPVQQAAALLVGDLLASPQFAGGLLREKLGDYSYAADRAANAISDRVRSLLAPFVDHRA